MFILILLRNWDASALIISGDSVYNICFLLDMNRLCICFFLNQKFKKVRLSHFLILMSMHPPSVKNIWVVVKMNQFSISCLSVLVDCLAVFRKNRMKTHKYCVIHCTHTWLQYYLYWKYQYLTEWSMLNQQQNLYISPAVVNSNFSQQLLTLLILITRYCKVI